jgi:hypothetical protein
VRGPWAWLAGVFRRRPEPEPAEDPRAEELRRRLEESRTVAEEQHEEAASLETPVDAVTAPEREPQAGPEPTPVEVEDRRRAVHERARAAAEEMLGDSPSE